MKITEVTDIYLTELDVKKAFRDFVLPQVHSADTIDPATGRAEAQVNAADIEEYYPRDGQTENFKNKYYVFNRETLRWVDDESGKNAGIVAQAQLMDKYGFTTSGQPQRSLLKKILAKKKNIAKTVKKFSSDDINTIKAAFTKARGEFMSRKTLHRFFRNSDDMLKYLAKGYDLKSLKKTMAPYFADMSGRPLGRNFAETHLIQSIYQHTFVKPDRQKFDAIKSSYESSAGGAGLDVRKTRDIEKAIKLSIRSYDAADVQKLPAHIDGLKSSGYNVNQFLALAQTEINNLVTTAPSLRDPAKISALFDMIKSLAPILPSISATYGPVLSSLNFSAMVPAITPDTLNNLEQKRGVLLTL